MQPLAARGWIIAIFGSGRLSHRPWSEAAGRAVAAAGAHLLTGGGQGVMAAAARAFVKAPGPRGISLGIIPGSQGEQGYLPKEGYPSPWVEIPIYTHLEGSDGPQGKDSRNRINTLTAHGAIILPGAEGTLAEVLLFEKLEKPMVFYGPEEAWKRMGRRQPRCAHENDLRQWLQEFRTDKKRSAQSTPSASIS